MRSTASATCLAASGYSLCCLLAGWPSLYYNITINPVTTLETAVGCEMASMLLWSDMCKRNELFHPNLTEAIQTMVLHINPEQPSIKLMVTSSEYIPAFCEPHH